MSCDPYFVDVTVSNSGVDGPTFRIYIEVGERDLTIANLEQNTNSVAKAAITQVHELGARAVRQDSEVEEQPITQVHVLTISTPVSRGSISRPALTQDQTLEIAGVEQVSSVQGRSITQDHELGGAGILGSPSVALAAIEQTHVLAPAEVIATPSVNPASMTAYGILAVYALDSGTTPVHWRETMVIEGNFGPDEGLVYVDEMAATVLEWTHDRIEALPVQGQLPYDGNYDVHVDRPV